MLCDNLEGWDGMGWDGGRVAQEGDDICKPMTDSCCYMAEISKPMTDSCCYMAEITTIL